MPLQKLRWNGTGWVIFQGHQSGGGGDEFIVDVTQPTAENTGPQIALTDTYSGTMNISAPTVISGVEITGRVVVLNAASGVVIIEHCLIDASSIAKPATQQNVVSIQQNTGATVIVRFCEIIGQEGMIGIGTRRFVAYRNNIHNVEDAVRLNNSGGTGQAMNAEVYANMLGPLIMATPDTYNTRSDNKTHSDVIQIEGGDGISIHGNTLFAMATTDGTSNVDWIRDVSPHDPLPFGDPAGRAHPQALSALMVSSGVSPTTNLSVYKNWAYGGDIPFNLGHSTNSDTTGTITENEFDRMNWTPDQGIYKNTTATGVTTSGNVYMDDGTPVPVKTGS